MTDEEATAIKLARFLLRRASSVMEGDVYGATMTAEAYAYRAYVILKRVFSKNVPENAWDPRGRKHKDARGGG